MAGKKMQLRFNERFLVNWIAAFWPAPNSLNHKAIPNREIRGYAAQGGNWQTFETDGRRNYRGAIPEDCKDIVAFYGHQKGAGSFVNLAEFAMQGWFLELQCRAQQTKRKEGEEDKPVNYYEVARDDDKTTIKQHTGFRLDHDDLTAPISVTVDTNYGVQKRERDYYASIADSTVEIEDDQWQQLLEIAKTALAKKQKLEEKDVMKFLPFIVDSNFRELLTEKIVQQNDQGLAVKFLKNTVLLLAENGMDEDIKFLAKKFGEKFGFQAAFDLVSACPNNPAVVDLFFTRRPKGLMQTMLGRGGNYADQAQVEQLASLWKVSEHARKRIQKLYPHKVDEIEGLANITFSDTQIQQRLAKAETLAAPTPAKVATVQPPVQISHRTEVSSKNDAAAIQALIDSYQPKVEPTLTHGSPSLADCVSSDDYVRPAPGFSSSAVAG